MKRNIGHIEPFEEITPEKRMRLNSMVTSTEYGGSSNDRVQEEEPNSLVTDFPNGAHTSTNKQAEANIALDGTADAADTDETSTSDVMEEIGDGDAKGHAYNEETTVFGEEVVNEIFVFNNHVEPNAVPVKGESNEDENFCRYLVLPCLGKFNDEMNSLAKLNIQISLYNIEHGMSVSLVAAPHVNAVDQRQRAEDEAFCRHLVVPTLKKLTPERNSRAKLEICWALHSIQFPTRNLTYS